MNWCKSLLHAHTPSLIALQCELCSLIVEDFFFLLFSCDDLLPPWPAGWIDVGTGVVDLVLIPPPCFPTIEGKLI